MIYGYRCDHCACDMERVCSLAAYEANAAFPCTYCGGPTRQILYAPAAVVHAGQFEAFVSPVDGRVISSRRELAEHNRRNNVVNIHDGYDEKAVMGMTKKDYQKPLDDERKKDLRQDLEKAIAQCSEGYQPTVAREDSPL